MVSVPYRGATFLNRIKEVDNYGKNMFPSPIGELHFSIVHPPLSYRAKVWVSVPYRGATFLNLPC